jgi:hypothetical protein
MTTARQFGAAPTTRELVDRLMAVVAEQGERLEALERKIDGADGEDGPAPMPLPPSWMPIKQAAAAAGYAGESGIRKAMKRAKRNREPAWWCYRGSRTWVDLDRCPRRL